MAIIFRKKWKLDNNNLQLKFKKMLEYDPQVSIEEGVERFFSWFKVNEDTK